MRYAGMLMALVLALYAYPCFSKPSLRNLRNGDVIFHMSQSRQSNAIEAATGSHWTHMGFLFKDNNKWYVVEASSSVKRTLLSTWIKRGKNQDFVVKRQLRTNGKSGFTRSELRKMETDYRTSFQGRKYDVLFEWSDDKMYCSELVFKLFAPYLSEDEFPGEIQKFKEMNLEHPEVKRIALERYPGLSWQQVKRKISNQLIVTPVSMYNSPNLKLVYTTNPNL